MTLDIMSNAPFVSTTYKAIWRENLVVNQMSPRAFSNFLLFIKAHK